MGAGIEIRLWAGQSRDQISVRNGIYLFFKTSRLVLAHPASYLRVPQFLNGVKEART
jgi:hypothetical protein